MPICVNCDASDICLDCQDGAESIPAPKGDSDVCKQCGEADCLCVWSPWATSLAYAHPAYKAYVMRLREKARAQS